MSQDQEGSRDCSEVKKCSGAGGKMQQIVISDSSSESEAEDPLFNGTAEGGPQRMMSSLHHHYCESSEHESSSDDDLPPLLDRIGSKRKDTLTSPLKAKLSPTKDIMVSKMIFSQATTHTRKKLGFESQSRLKSCCTCDELEGEAQAQCGIVNHVAREKLSSGSVLSEMVDDEQVMKMTQLLSNDVNKHKMRTGSAESPIEID